MKLRLSGIKPESVVDGPGIRFVLYVQGCSRRCPGCHNPGTHDPAGGVEADLGLVLGWIREARPALDGVTFSGGEPFEQAEALAELARGVRRLGLDIVIYSGYTFEELLEKSEEDPHVRGLLEAGSLLVDGSYIQEERDLALPYRGSRNQRLINISESLKRGVAVEKRLEACA